MIIVVAKIRFENQADRDRAVELSTPVQQATRDQEAGCHDYCFSADPCDGNIIQVYELWQDSDSLAAHFDHSNYFDMVEVFREAKFVESVNRCHLTERDEPVYGPEGAKKTAFFT